MKKGTYFGLAVLSVLLSCKDDDERLFDKTADERAAEAIATLRQELIRPSNGWIVRYTPQEDAGAYYVLMKFHDNGKVEIKTDFAAQNGAFFRDTISYRIDNSLGLELILENYSFFSFLFEQDLATFGAEFEFDYVNKTPDNALVFQSKSDVGQKGIILFEEASADDENLLGNALGTNLNILANDFQKFTSSLKLTYDNKNLALYLALDELRRTITITAASLKSNTATAQSLNFTTTYLIEGTKLIFAEPFQGTALGNSINIATLQLTDSEESIIGICAQPITVHSVSGITSAGDNVTLETSLADVSGRSFGQSDWYFTPLVYVFDNGRSVGEQIVNDIEGALEMHMYYGLERQGAAPLYGLGLVIRNADGTVTFALREFAPVFNDNNLVFNFASDISIYGDPPSEQTLEDIDNHLNNYLDPLAEGDNTYVFQLQEDIYEFHNPCTGWSFVLINAQ